MQSKFKQQVAT